MILNIINKTKKIFSAHPKETDFIPKEIQKDLINLCANQYDSGCIPIRLFCLYNKINPKLLRFIRAPKKQSLLHLAVLNRTYEDVQFLVQNNCDITQQDKDGNTPLHLAIRPSHKKTVFLASHAPISLLEQPNKKGETPYDIAKGYNADNLISFFNLISGKETAPKIRAVIAAKYGWVEIFNEPNLNLSVNGKDGNSLAHLAVANNHLKFLKRLYEKGGKLNTKNNDGNTPAHLAAQEGYVHILKFLSKHTDILTPLNSSKKTPLDIAHYKFWDLWENASYPQSKKDSFRINLTYSYLQQLREKNAPCSQIKKDFLPQYPTHIKRVLMQKYRIFPHLLGEYSGRYIDN